MSEITETADQAAYRAEVRAWYDANATPKKPDDPWATNIHLDPEDALRHFEGSRAWLGKLHAAGYSGIAWPTEYGGGGGASWMTRIEREISHDYEEFTGFPGATLAMLLAARRPEIAGIFSINGAIRLRSRRIVLVPAVVALDRVARRLRISGRRAQLAHRSESPETNYDVNPLWSVRELYRAVWRCTKELPHVKAPALVIQSSGDPVIDPVSAQCIRDRIGGPCLVSRLPGDRHNIVNGPGSAPVLERVSRFLDLHAEA